MLKVLKHILMTRPIDNPMYLAYSEAVKELQSDCSYELRRLAMKMPDYLMVWPHDFPRWIMLTLTRPSMMISRPRSTRL